MSAELTAQSTETTARIAPGLPPEYIARPVVAWTQLFGAVTFELTGQLVGIMDPAGPFFEYAVERMADLVGLPG
ncbi:TetR-like C-terminal domain-containing protein [Nocardia acidivorans]|uniref:TetR-like C-terminal domain-containing protein n=1 Tax=Nocardia acidivorans TaxID=404580 RepID=UPI00082D869C|nr:TetR-like C-terminal domain-containing protein [Nocardia acidivorans]